MSVFDRLSRWWRSLGGAESDDAQERRGAQGRDAQEPGVQEEEDGASDEPVMMQIEESIDLHHFAPRDIPSVVVEYLREAQLAGFREVRIIHGKGKGVQRRRVQVILQDRPEVESYRSDGLGSTLVWLRRRRQ
jgi:dsDNA-specific endonuclease/ATPase MutS2